MKEEEEGKAVGRGEGRGGVGSLGNLEEVLVELRIQHGNFRLHVFVQDQGKHGKHGVDGRIPGGMVTTRHCSPPHPCGGHRLPPARPSTPACLPCPALSTGDSRYKIEVGGHVF